MAMIRERLSVVRQDIERVCGRIGRDPQEIVLVGVTKFARVEQIQDALDSGLAHIGENKVQEAQKKFPLLERGPASFARHMIGHLQTNKVKAALGLFDMIQSVDSLKLIRALDAESGRLGRRADILLQVNTSGEVQKYGFSPDEVMEAVGMIAGCPHLQLKGLMTMAPFTDDTEVIRRTFRDLRRLKDRIREHSAGDSRVTMKYLSMGMTHDYEIALEEGANMLRIGSAIFKGDSV